MSEGIDKRATPSGYRGQCDAFGSRRNCGSAKGGEASLIRVKRGVDGRSRRSTVGA
ncbi:hypothetical protein THIOKS12100005 [Thiocapsa sp. KS1]|nr:hypothetical protein THIOKS12100005 [Thiocapsa sp. KS1]